MSRSRRVALAEARVLRVLHRFEERLPDEAR
jgi:hypothetical protein